MKFAVVLLITIAIFATSLPVFADFSCDTTTDYDDLGVVQYNNGEFEQAIQSFNCAVQIDPESATAFNWRGNAYRSLGNYEAAIADYNQSLEIDEDYAMAYNNRGWTYYSMNDFDAALADYDKALELDPDMAYAYNNRGLIFQFKGEEDRAARDFNQAIALELAPDWAEYNLSLIGVEDMLNNASSAYREREFEAAISFYTQALAIDPTNANAYYYRGRSHIATDNAAAAFDDFNHLVELEPDFVYGYWERAIAGAELGNFESALADAATAFGMDSEHINNFISRGTIAALMQDDAEAGQQFLNLMQAWEEDRTDYDMVEEATTLNIEMHTGGVHVIPFTATAGQTVTVHADSTEADPIIVILDPSGTPINGDDDSGTSLNSHICQFELTEDGTYTLMVSHAGGGSNGLVEVSITVE